MALYFNHQSKFDASKKALKASALVQPCGVGWGKRWEGASGWGDTRTPMTDHVNVWQETLQYSKVISLQLKKK